MEISNNFEFKSPEKIKEFIKDNERTVEIINAIEPQLYKHFPKSRYSLEVCENLNWTSETKLLLNVNINEETFFNGMLNHFNDIYSEIEPIIGNDLCPVVLFPEIQEKKFDKLNNNSAINLIARTAYFNNDNDGSIECELKLRDIPKHQRKKEILEYCRTHEDIWAPDIVEELLLDYDEINEILEELEKEGKIQEIK